MRFSTVFTVLGGAAMVAANGAAVLSAINTISADAVALNKTVSQFNGLLSILSALTIYTQSQQLLKDINNGTAVANASAPFDIPEAFALIPPTQTLVANTISVLQTIQRKKPAFDQALISGIILDNLKQQKAAADAFNNATIAKVPFFAQDLARSYTAPLDPAFNAAIATYTTKFTLPKLFGRQAIAFHA